MTATPLIDLSDAVQARLRGAVPDLTHTTSGALDFEALVQGGALPSRLPAAFVINGGLLADTTARVGRLSLRLREAVAVVLVQGSLRDTSGAAARAAVWPLQRSVLLALTGWAPAAGYDPLAPEAVRLQALGGDARTGAVAVTLEFATSWTWHVTPFS